jgi:hypothetical protein
MNSSTIRFNSAQSGSIAWILLCIQQQHQLVKAPRAQQIVGVTQTTCVQVAVSSCRCTVAHAWCLPAAAPCRSLLSTASLTRSCSRLRARQWQRWHRQRSTGTCRKCRCAADAIAAGRFQQHLAVLRGAAGASTHACTSTQSNQHQHLCGSSALLRCSRCRYLYRNVLAPKATSSCCSCEWECTAGMLMLD